MLTNRVPVPDLINPTPPIRLTSTLPASRVKSGCVVVRLPVPIIEPLVKPMTSKDLANVPRFKVPPATVTSLPSGMALRTPRTRAPSLTVVRPV